MFVESIEENLKRHRRWAKKHQEIKELNDSLIAKWRSIPWWKFWEKPSFEKQRQIIIDNWSRLR